jgi:hypothetical protein
VGHWPPALDGLAVKRCVRRELDDADDVRPGLAESALSGVSCMSASSCMAVGVDDDGYDSSVAAPRSVGRSYKVPITRYFYGHGWARTSDLSRVKRALSH